MTNGEKLVSEHPAFIAHFLAETCNLYGDCEQCPLFKTGDCGNAEEIEKWLKEEAKEDGR